MSDKILIYGANGYTGLLAVREAVAQGLPVIVAARSEKNVKPIAEELGLDFRAFAVEDSSDYLQDIAVVLNCAGPFSATAAPLIAACIAQSVHYVDITGEMSIFQLCYEKREEAKAAGVILCPGAGFDIVPTDCLAAKLKEALPTANEINLAFAFGTRPSVGTAKTLVEATKFGGFIRKNGELVAVANGYARRKIRFADRKRWGVTIPWADVYTSGISTGTEHGKVFVALPWIVGMILRVTSPIKGLFGLGISQAILMGLAKLLLSGGPDEAQRKTHKSQFWGEARAPDGTVVTGTLTAPSVYVTTVLAALKVTTHCAASSGDMGYYTPSMLLGPDLILSLEGAVMNIEVPK